MTKECLFRVVILFNVLVRGEPLHQRARNFIMIH